MGKPVPARRAAHHKKVSALTSVSRLALGFRQVLERFENCLRVIQTLL